jgi:hypothetical protein
MAEDQFMTMKRLPTTAAAVVAALGVLFSAAPSASADGIGNTTACMTGTVDPLDDASYDEDFGADQWKFNSGVKLTSDSQKVVLSVFDDYGNSICVNTADLTTSCKFQTGFTSTFTIRVDNTQNATAGNYTVCSF